MTYSAVVSLTQTISKILDDYDRYSISIDERHQLVSINEYVIFLEAFLENFPDKATRLEDRIRDVANAAEDALEYFMWEQICLHNDISSRLPESLGSDEYSGQTSCISMCFKRKPSGVRVEEHGFHIDFKGFEKVMEEVSGIAGEVMDMKNTFKVSEVQAHPHADLLTASSSATMGSIVKSEMVGFRDDLLAVKSRVYGESPKLQVIPIVGMGGIGKTTLARNVYDDSLIIEHFDIRVWVTMSQDYTEDAVLSQLLHSLRVSSIEGAYQSLMGRRYLIVLDDMWSTEVWDDLRRLCPNDHNGSRIMLTTSILDVANCASFNSPPHEMHFMDDEQSWNLLENMVFMKENCPPNLENIGRRIVRNCGGLPLAIVVIAGVLLTVSKTQTSWENVAEDVIRVVMRNDDEFAMTVLSLSYKHLPQHLRQCFLYMGCFPKDYKIYATKLINLWVGEGFLKPSGCMSMEEWGEECLSDLVRRNLVLFIEKKANEEIKICGMHDLVWDLCIRKSHEEKFLLHVMDHGEACLESMRNPCRICSIFGSVLDCLEIMDSYITGGKVCLESMRSGPRRICSFDFGVDFLDTINGSTIHTIVCFGKSGITTASLANYRLLRVLGVVNFLGVSIPNELFELFHLRYLSFDPIMGQNIVDLDRLVEVKIPATILNLVNLQILIIIPRKILGVYVQAPVPLPLEFWRMTQLRHLESYCIVELPDPEGVPACILENMRSLSEVRNFVFSTRVIERIPNLKKLGISYDKREDWNHQDFQFENMVFLHQLEKLKMKMPMYVHNPYWHNPYWHKFKHPAFPRALKELSLSGCGQVAWRDMSVIGLLPNLQVLKLKAFIFMGGAWETHEGEFLGLKCLLIRYTNLKHWITESSHFPLLNRLRLYGCFDFAEIPESVGEIATLELLEVNRMNEGVLNSSKRIKEVQQDYGNDAFQLRIESNVY